MAKISVIIPVYNVEKYLKRCLNSVINQTYKDLEIILVNDGATDSSPKICNEYAQKDSRIKIVIQDNAGLSAARNTGLDNATGDYIGFVDSDDWLSLNFYETLYNAISENNADISFCDVVRINEKKEKIRLNIKTVETADDIDSKLKLSKYNEHRGVWNRLYKKELFDDGLRFEEGKYYEDGLFTLKILNKCNRIVSTPNAYYYYYINPTSIVKSRPSLKKIQDKITTRINVLNYATENGIKIFDKKNMPATFKVSTCGLTLFVKKENQFENRYYLFGSILVYKKKK